MKYKNNKVFLKKQKNENYKMKILCCEVKNIDKKLKLPTDSLKDYITIDNKK